MTVRQYMEALWCFDGTEVKPDMTATEIYTLYPDNVKRFVSVFTNNAVPEHAMIPMFEVLIQQMEFGELEPVKEIAVNGNVYQAVPDYHNLIDDSVMVYGKLDFGTCLNLFTLMDVLKPYQYMHKAMALLYTGGNDTHIRATDMLMADAIDGASVMHHFNIYRKHIHDNYLSKLPADYRTQDHKRAGNEAGEDIMQKFNWLGTLAQAGTLAEQEAVSRMQATDVFGRLLYEAYKNKVQYKTEEHIGRIQMEKQRR